MHLRLVFIKLIILCINFALYWCAIEKSENAFRNAPLVKCNNKTEKKLDRLMVMIIPLGTDEPRPETQAQLKQFCNLVTKNMPFLLGYVKHCVSRFGQTAAKLIIFPLRKQLNSVCRPGKLSRQAREWLETAKCGNKANDRIKECKNSFIDSVAGIAKAPDKSKIAMTCCNSHAFSQCLREATEETDGCTRHTVDFAEKTVEKVVGSAIGLVCGEYFNDSDKCSKLIRSTPKVHLDESYVRSKTLFKPMVRLVESFSESPELS